MRRRCFDPSNEFYEYYGGRGITICERWSNYALFLADMGEAPKGLSIDRYPDNDGNYEPGNCRWATVEQQNNNSRNCHFLTINGETKSIAQWSKISNISSGTIRVRVSALNWTAEDAVFSPLRKRGQHGIRS